MAQVQSANQNSRRSRPAGIAVAVALAAVAAAAPAAGQSGPSRDLDVTTFRPAPRTGPGMLTLDGPDVGAHGQWALALFLYHAVDPLVVESAGERDMTDRPIAARSVAELAGAVSLGRVELGASLPFIEQSGTMPGFSGVQPADGSTMGDLSLRAKTTLVDLDPLALGALAEVTLPTAEDGMFAGSAGPTAQARALIGVDRDHLRVVANAGFRLRPSERFGDVEQGNELTYGLAAAFRVIPQVSVVGEAFGAFGLEAVSTRGVSPLEVALAVRYWPTSTVGVTLGGGRGILPGVGSPAARGFALLSFAPGRGDPSQPGRRRHRPTAPGDEDGDGVPNAGDDCPRTGEDRDGFEDDDGCPEPDNDGDGLADEVDSCAIEAEDRDGFDDQDGCPDPDNDADGVPDVADQCPGEAEDKDGFADEDGCPDADNDRDGVADIIDKCADEPETINANDDDDGCPDEGETSVLVLRNRIETFEPVWFRGSSAEIRGESHAVLGQVAALMRARRDIHTLRVAVHVHGRGDDAADLARARKRAEAVRTWLVEWGVEPERIEAKGYGSRRPLVGGDSRRARSTNTRVEFILLERRGGSAR